MIDGNGAGAGGASFRAVASRSFCSAIDRTNTWVARYFGFLIVFVTGVVIFEIAARNVFGRATLWANETTIYLSAVAYLLGGGYALLKNAHVRIDLVYENLSGRVKILADSVSFVCFSLYVGALVWVGAQMAWTSFLQREGTGTPWDPAIWPVKMAIPLAGLLLLLQGVANFLRQIDAARANDRAGKVDRR